MFDFGLRIRELRESRKMSQEELGRRVGRSKPVISSYENNIKIPPLDILTNIAVIFNVSLDYLVGIDKNEMISIEGLTEQQKKTARLLISEFKNKSNNTEGLSEQQLTLINMLIKEFTKRK